MVDPNRKINRLTEKDIEFLDECQEEFANRFTEDDEEFALHCSKPLVDPPVIENWGFSGPSNNYRGGGRGQRNNYDSGNRSSRGGWNKRGRDRGYRGGGQSYRNNYRHYSNKRTHDGHFREEREGERDERPQQPMNIRRDYGNFVRASKE